MHWLAPYTSSSSNSGNVGFSSISAHVQVALIKYINKLKLSHENYQNYVISSHRTEETGFINTTDFFNLIPSLQTYRSSLVLLILIFIAFHLNSICNRLIIPKIKFSRWYKTIKLSTRSSYLHNLDFLHFEHYKSLKSHF